MSSRIFLAPYCGQKYEVHGRFENEIILTTHLGWISSYLGLKSRGEFLDKGTNDVQLNDVNEEKAE